MYTFLLFTIVGIATLSSNNIIHVYCVSSNQSIFTAVYTLAAMLVRLCIWITKHLESEPRYQNTHPCTQVYRPCSVSEVA